MRSRNVAALAALCLAAAYSVSPSPPAARAVQLYEVDARVLDRAPTGPVICTGVFLKSLPPQCHGLPVTPWDWSAVEGEESAGGVTWSEPLHLVGSFDGTTFRLVGPPGPSIADVLALLPPLPKPPCPPPGGDWQVVSRYLATSVDYDNAVEYALKQPDYAGRWVASPDPASGVQPTRINVFAFTGDLDRHERALRGRYGGRLCVTRHARSYKDLEALRDRLGVLIRSSSIDDATNMIDAGTLVADDATRREIETLVGPGVVRLTGVLKPL